MAPTQRLHFQSLHLLSFLFICTLHLCEHCTVLEVAPNAFKFSMTVLCVIAAYGVVCRPVLVGTLFAPTQGLHFQAVHPLSFLFICTLHWCKHYLKVAPNLGKFLFTALCQIPADGVICRLILVGAPFTPTQGLHFQALHSVSFLFICTLRWCKHCIRLEVAPTLDKFPFTALCRLAADAIVCWPVLVGARFTPTEGLHFQAIHSLTFLFICTLHLCKHCTRIEAAPNLGKFPFTALCRIAADGVVCRAVLVGAPFATTQDFRFLALHLLSFHFIYTLHWCKHCTWLKVAPNVGKF